MRVSTQDQDLENQRIRLEEFCKFRDWDIVRTYSDKISGLKDSRPGLNQMLLDARKKKFDVVVSVKLDRLGRSTGHLLQLVEELNHYGVDIAFTDQPIDTTSSMGRFTFQILSAVAEFERELIRERTISGLERARRNGKIIGRPTKVTFKVRDEIFAMWDNHFNKTQIAKSMNLSRRTVYRVIHEY